MNDLKIFQNEEFGKVRVVIQDGEPWFVGKDVANALGYSNTRDALEKHVDEEDKYLLLKSQFTTLENHIPKDVLNVNFVVADIPNRGLTIINESGVYSLTFSSKLPSAKAFKRWVTHDILPSIARTGKYENPNSPQTNGTITIDEDSLVRIGSVFCTETVKALLPFIRPQTEPAPVVVTADLPKEPRKRRLVPLKDFSDVLKWVQRKEGLSGFQIAREINVSERTVSLWRNGIVRPNPENFQRFVIRFNIPVSELEEGVFD